MRRYKKGKKKGPVRSKKATADGIEFRSGLEKHTYLALKEAKLFEKYEEEVFQTLPSFRFSNMSFEKQSNGKGDMKNRGNKKILGIKYTPDFTGKDYIIECWCTLNNETRTLYKPQNQKDVALMIKLILDGRKQ